MTQVAFYEPALENMLENLAVLEEQIPSGCKEMEEMSLTKEIRFTGIDYLDGEKKIFRQVEQILADGQRQALITESSTHKVLFY